MNARGTRRPHPRRVFRKGRKHVVKSGSCSMAIPRALAAALVALAQLAAVKFWMRRSA